MESVAVHRDAGGETAIVFLHGFGGDCRTTWGRFPELLAAEPRLDGWDLYSLGYDTNLRLDLPGLWSACAPLDRIAVQLSTVIRYEPFERYRNLSFAAHSMGGLVVQRSLVDDPELAERTGHLALFGTPSAGLVKAGWLRFWKRQLRDMGPRSGFIRHLRQRWSERFGDRRPFAFLAVAGERDEFVDSASSLAPFARDLCRVAPGCDHLSLVKPRAASDLSVEILVALLAGDAAPHGPWSSARLAVERRQFTDAIRELWPQRAELDDDGLVLLALALESDGRADEAIAVLEECSATAGTDPLGVLAGRLKRRWLTSRRRTDAERALELYGQGLARAETAGRHDQALYHGINVAFLLLAFAKDRAGAERTAEVALAHCAAVAEPDHWTLATEGEACLHQGRDEEALALYGRAIGEGASPREIRSMYQQAMRLTGLLRRDATAARLERLFRGDAC